MIYRYGWMALLSGIVTAWIAGTVAQAATIDVVVSVGSRRGDGAFTMTFNPTLNAYVYNEKSVVNTYFKDDPFYISINDPVILTNTIKHQIKSEISAFMNSTKTYFSYRYSDFECAYWPWGSIDECTSLNIRINPSTNSYIRTSFYDFMVQTDIRDSVNLAFYEADGASFKLVPGPLHVPLPMTGLLLASGVAALVLTRRCRPGAVTCR